MSVNSYSFFFYETDFQSLSVVDVTLCMLHFRIAIPIPGDMILILIHCMGFLHCIAGLFVSLSCHVRHVMSVTEVMS